MHIHFEKAINAYCDCTILSMSWMGKVPDELPEDEGWKLNRTHYYQEGWLATGNVRGVLGVTYTTSHWKKNPSDVPHRTNYNLRGHRSQITLVQWNEPYQKLASCDSSGIIFVWIKFEGRWSIELINDRNTPVTHFSWSHDGRMALICYQDNFVLVGSVAGQRYWSTLLNLEATITCGIWTPDDQQVYFGTSNGQVVVMDVHGVMLSQVQLPSDSPISSMAWSCEKFKMEESEDGEATSSSNHYCNKRPFLLAVCIKTGGIYLMKSYDDVAPTYISTGMHGLQIEWSNSGEFLAVAGSRPIEVLHENGNRVKEYSNSLHVYNHQGVRIVNINIPHVLSPVTSMTWGHNDKRIFVATGKLVHVGWVSKRIASLQLLCRLAIYKSLSTETCVSHLPLPLPVRALISSLHTQTIPSLLPHVKDMRDFVSHPPNANLRLYCTMIRHDEDSNQSPGTSYTLYLEYMGGLIPILKGKRTSKIRPEFVIYDPQATEERGCTNLGFPYGVTGDSRSGGSVVACGINGNSSGGYCSCNCDKHRHYQHTSCQAGSQQSSCPGGAYCHHHHHVTICSCSVAHCAVGGENGNETNLATAGSSVGGDGGKQFCHCHCCCHHHHHCNKVQHGQASNCHSNASTTGSSVASLGFSDSSESEDVELCASPRMQRKRYRNRQRERERLLEREREREWERTRSSVHFNSIEPAHPHQLIYNDVLPESVRLVEVTSNIWGTKFKIHGVAPSLPDNLGQVTYKTSLLHLQPRQMTLLITELRDDIFFTPDSLFVHGSYAEEDEEDLSIIVGGPETYRASSSQFQTQQQQQQQLGAMHGGVIVHDGVLITGNGFRGNAYTGSNVIYHPQGVPRGEDSPPIISTSRCYLQSSSSSSSSSNPGYPQHNHYQQNNSCSSSSTQGASCSSTSSPFHQHHHHSSNSGKGECPSSSSAASSSSCCSSSQSSVPQYYASSCSSSSKTTPRSSEFASSLHFDVEDQDEFPYVDLTANSEIIHFRETLRNNWNNEQGNPTANACQVCETPMKVVGGGTAVGIANCAVEGSIFLDRSVQKAKYNLEGGGFEYNSHGGLEGPTPPPRNPSRSLRSPKKISGVGGSARLSTYQSSSNQVNQTATAAGAMNQEQAHIPLEQQPYSHQLPLHLQQQQQMQPVAVTAPMFVRRSISASYLDSVERNVAPSLDIAGNEQGQHPKRLILVKKSENGDGATDRKGNPKLKDWGKSKSWDSCDLSAWKKAGRGKEAYIEGTIRNGNNPSTSAYRKEISTSSCPKCRFPSTEPVRRYVTIMADSLVHCRANNNLRIPTTPVKRNGMTNSSGVVGKPSPLLINGGEGGGGNVRQTSAAGSSSSGGEDIIEIVRDSSPPAAQSIPSHHIPPLPLTVSPPPVSQSPPPPPPSTVHRRSLSLLTPLLRRREMLKAARQQQQSSDEESSNNQRSSSRGRSGSQNGSQQQQQSSTSNAPHSSSFIPPGSPQHQPRSSPSTPAAQRRSRRQSYLSSASSPFRQLFINSPLLTRRKSKSGNNNNSAATNSLGRHQRRKSIIDSSDEEGYVEEGIRARPQQIENNGSRNNCVICSDMGSPCTHASVPSSAVPCVQNTPLRGEGGEILQKSQQKMGRKKIQCMEPCLVSTRRREFLMHNKAPMWNENSQVYQLDFGGRVTQESAKNFQIEFRGKQVMQFGRIDGSAYTLDFQYPFAAVQAFSVALANVTQRLK